MPRNRKEYFKKLREREKAKKPEEQLDSKTACSISDPTPQIAVQLVIDPKRDVSFVKAIQIRRGA